MLPDAAVWKAPARPPYSDLEQPACSANLCAIDLTCGSTLVVGIDIAFQYTSLYSKSD